MDFFEVVEKRQSIRAFESRPIEAEKLQKILEATNRAPSAGNFQAFEVYVVETKEKRDTLTAATFNQPFVAQAPLSIVFCTNVERCTYPGAEMYSMQDTSIACTFAMLAVTAVGLSSVWIGAFDPKKVAAVIGAPEGVVPVAFLAIGYAAENPPFTSRRELVELVKTV